jgi:hypothetical protein
MSERGRKNPRADRHSDLGPSSKDWQPGSAGRDEDFTPDKDLWTAAHKGNLGAGRPGEDVHPGGVSGARASGSGSQGDDIQPGTPKGGALLAVAPARSRGRRRKTGPGASGHVSHQRSPLAGLIRHHRLGSRQQRTQPPAARPRRPALTASRSEQERWATLGCCGARLAARLGVSNLLSEAVAAAWASPTTAAIRPSASRMVSGSPGLTASGDLTACPPASITSAKPLARIASGDAVSRKVWKSRQI